MEKDKIKKAFQEMDKFLCDKGFEDEMRRAKFDSMIHLLSHNKFMKRDLLVLYILFDNQNSIDYIKKCLAYVKCAKENLDEVSVKDLKEHLLKIGEFKK